MPTIKARRLAQLFEAASKDRTPADSHDRYFHARSGQRIFCESRDQYKFWSSMEDGFLSKEIRPDEFSVRDIFEAFVPDGRELLREWQAGSSISLTEAAGAVVSTNFSNITGQVVYNALLAAYEMPIFSFTQMILTIQTEFNGERIAGISRIGDQAAIVPELQAFPLAGVNEDYIDTPPTVKRGLIVPISKEAIFFDRTNMILQNAAEVGEWLGLNKEKRAIDCLVDENTTAHRYKWRGSSYGTYQTSTPWINSKTSNALENWSNIAAVELLFANITDPNTGEAITVMPDTLIVNPQLAPNASYILNATQVFRVSGGYPTSGNLNQTFAPNPVGANAYSGQYKVLTSRYMPARTATDSDWFLGQPNKAMAYMQNWPIRVDQAPAYASADFNNDIVAQFKASERGAFVVRDPRYMAKSAA